MGYADRWLAESGKILPILAPVNITGGTWVSDVFNMGIYGHATIVVSAGAWAGGTSTMTVEYCDNVTPDTDTPMAFRYYSFVGGAGASDTIGTLTAVGVGGVAISVANTTFIIEVDANEIAASDATQGTSAYLRVKGTSPSSNNDYISIVAFLSVPKYSGNTAIT